MQLSLDSKRWAELQHAYGAGENIPPLLYELLAKPDPKSSRFEQLWQDIWNILCHQGTVGSASYAAVPYVVQAASSLAPFERLEYLHFIGHVEVFRASGPEQNIPDFLQEAYFAAHQQAVALALESLQEDWPEDELQILLSTLAILKGKQPLGAAIGRLYKETTCPVCDTKFVTNGYSWFPNHNKSSL